MFDMQSRYCYAFLCFFLITVESLEDERIIKQTHNKADSSFPKLISSWSKSCKSRLFHKEDSFYGPDGFRFKFHCTSKGFRKFHKSRKDTSVLDQALQNLIVIDRYIDQSR